MFAKSKTLHIAQERAENVTKRRGRALVSTTSWKLGFKLESSDSSSEPSKDIPPLAPTDS